MRARIVRVGKEIKYEDGAKVITTLKQQLVLVQNCNMYVFNYSHAYDPKKMSTSS